MSRSRTALKGGLAAGWRHLMSALIAIAAVLALSALAAPSARADDRPFWEKGDSVAKTKRSKGSYGRTASRHSNKSYASNSKGYKLGGYAAATEPKRHRKGVRVASLDGGYYGGGSSGSLTGGGARWAASSGCLDGNLRSVISQVSTIARVTVNSTCRSHSHNRAVGGAPHSKHLTGDAVDFRVHGNVGAVYAYLKSSGAVGGLKHYGGGLFHIDNGERRSW